MGIHKEKYITKRHTKFEIDRTSYKKVMMSFLSTLRSPFIVTTETNLAPVVHINTILKNAITFLSLGLFT